MSVQCSGRGGFARGGGHKFEPQQPRSVATLREKHVTCDGDEWVAGWWGHPPALWFRGSCGHPPARIVISTGIRLPAGSDENGSDTNGYTSIRIQIVIFSRTRIRTQIVPDTDTNTDRAQIVSTYGCGSNT
jgi:hypothetical protein